MTQQFSHVSFASTATGDNLTSTSSRLTCSFVLFVLLHNSSKLTLDASYDHTLTNLMHAQPVWFLCRNMHMQGKGRFSDMPHYPTLLTHSGLTAFILCLHIDWTHLFHIFLRAKERKLVHRHLLIFIHKHNVKVLLGVRVFVQQLCVYESSNWPNCLAVVM